MDAVATAIALMAVQKTDAEWIDLTDGGYTTLHKHKAPLPSRTYIEKIGHPSGPYSTADPFFCNSTSGCSYNTNTYPVIQVAGYTYQPVDFQQLKLTYRGVEHVGTSDVPGDFTFSLSTHDYGSGSVPVTQWYITLTTGTSEGSYDIVARGFSNAGDSDSDYWTVIVDNTAPIISADWVTDPARKDYKSDPNIWIGEYINIRYTGSDAHWYRVSVPVSVMTTGTDTYQTDLSYTSGWIRTKSTLAVGSHTITVRAYDYAGNFADSSPVLLNCSEGPSIPALVSFTFYSGTGPYPPPRTAYSAELSGSSYTDNVVASRAQILSALLVCRNSGHDDRITRFQSGTLTTGLGAATTLDGTHYVGSVSISNQSSTNTGTESFYIADQFYHTRLSPGTDIVWYNNHKSADYSSDPVLANAYLGFPFNKVGYETFADGVQVSNLIGCRIYDGEVNIQATSGSFETILDLSENTHTTYQVRISRRDTQSEIDWSGWGSKLKALYWTGSIWKYCNNSQDPSLPSFGSGSFSRFDTAAVTTLKIKLVWTATIPDIEILGLLYIK